ncbi:MAG: type II secretion system protein [Planctomycetota bacterium]|jgi:prepilin-type N-terminal cleavage/methylation domain-containing protein
MSVRRKGFTLIELLVVIAIIALLMSILMPALRNVRDQAKNSMCLQRLQQWGVMFNMYAGEWDGVLMGWNEFAWNGGQFVEHAWIPMMYDYAKDFEIYLCPSATKLWGTGEGFDTPESAWDFQYLMDGEWSDWEFYDYYAVGTPPNQKFSYGSYGKNEWVCNGYEWGNEPDGSTWHFLNIRVRGVANIPLHGDANWAAGFPTTTDDPAEIRNHPPVCGCGGEINRWNLDRHNLSVNHVFLDWSVRKVGLRQLWSLTWNKQRAQDGSPGWGNITIQPDWNDPMQWPEWMRNSKNYDL